MPLENMQAPQVDKDIVVICGPTGVGKTALALAIANRIPAEIVAADSRQVYKFMNVGTGKDLPKDATAVESDIIFKSEPVVSYVVGNTACWGYDLVDPHESFSVSDYVAIARRIVKGIWMRGKTPIVVGGTGLYVKALLDGIGTGRIPPDPSLREILNSMSVDDLYEHLATLDSSKAASLNKSDRHNPRRLIRAIEVAQWIVRGGQSRPISHLSHARPFIIGLGAPQEWINSRIAKRVQDRVNAGMESEVKDLIAHGIGWETQAMTALGYSLWKKVFNQSMSIDELRNAWEKQEANYARRQLVWFRKDTRVVWFDVTHRGWERTVENKLLAWHNREDDA